MLDCTYIGCQLVEELDRELASYYRARFWARVELEPFVPEDDDKARRLIAPDAFRDNLYWGAAPTAGLVLERGLAIGHGPRGHGSCCSATHGTCSAERSTSTSARSN